MNGSNIAGGNPVRGRADYEVAMKMVNNTEDVELDKLVGDIIHIGYVNGYNQLAQMAQVAPYNHIEPLSLDEAKQSLNSLIQQEANRQKLELLDRIWEAARWSTPDADEPEYFTREAIKAEREQLEQLRKKYQ